MGRTRQFGNLKYRPNRSNPTRIVASFQTPREAFDKWPGLAERQSKSFPASAETPFAGTEQNTGMVRELNLLLAVGAPDPGDVPSDGLALAHGLHRGEDLITGARAVGGP